ncbi:MAG: cell envelope integrity inner rane protein TolA [Pedosphaera sp.]|nr:cell envelope integrity inner rane protein TolA [Pedosphaera sp.]
MSRLEKKCFIASSAFHGLLFAILLFGAAFLVPANKVEPVHPLTVYSEGDVTDALSSGGDSSLKAAPSPAPQVEKPQPAPPTPPAPQPDPPKVEKIKPVEPPKHSDPVKPEPPKKLTAKDLEPISHIDKTKPADSKKSKLDPESLKPIVRKPSDKKAKAQKDQDDAADREYKAMAAARQKAAAEFNKTFKSLSKNMSSSTLVQTTSGTGINGGGPAAANYRDLVFSRYYNAWNPPADTDDTREVMVSITISRDGNVLNARIVKRSGNAALDRSIQNVIENVTVIAPFPPGATEPERVFKIIFTLEAKRAIG